MRRLLLATTNPDKIKEIRAILAGLPVELIGLDEVAPVDAPEETGSTFEDNARLKARYYAHTSGLTAIAEDSGLAIDELGGAPGVESARFGGSNTTYPQKFALIYNRLRQRGVTTSTARFICVVAIASSSGILFEARGTVEGSIAPSPAGSSGFGYDPSFSIRRSGARSPKSVANRRRPSVTGAPRSRKSGSISRTSNFQLPTSNLELLTS